MPKNSGPHRPVPALLHLPENWIRDGVVDAVAVPAPRIAIVNAASSTARPVIDRVRTPRSSLGRPTGATPVLANPSAVMALDTALLFNPGPARLHRVSGDAYPPR